MIQNIKQIKTTVIGVVLMIAGLAFQYMLYEKSIFEINYFPIGLLVVGLGFIFAPDTLIEVLKKYVTKKAEQ